MRLVRNRVLQNYELYDLQTLALMQTHAIPRSIASPNLKDTAVPHQMFLTAAILKLVKTFTKYNNIMFSAASQNCMPKLVTMW